MTLGRIYTLSEAAEKLRVGKNRLAKLARNLGIGALDGRDLRFTEADLQALWAAMRVPAKDAPVHASGVTALARSKRLQKALADARQRDKARRRGT